MLCHLIAQTKLVLFAHRVVNAMLTDTVFNCIRLQHELTLRAIVAWHSEV